MHKHLQSNISALAKAHRSSHTANDANKSSVQDTCAEVLAEIVCRTMKKMPKVASARAVGQKRC